MTKKNNVARVRFLKAFENSDIVEPIEDNQIVTEENGSLAYETDEYLITLMCDFTNDIYTLVLKRK